ncbi:MAG: MsnO8 family LLM class oxidoreductase [Microbacteriaceae bacterium]
MYPKLSILDPVPIRDGQTAAQSVAASLATARLADRLGYERWWFTEHHGMPSTGATAPQVLMAATAALTESIRVGSGGVVLPRHDPVTIAEHFITLEAIAPGRIDLGLARGVGPSSYLGGKGKEDAEFTTNVRTLRELVDTGRIRRRIGPRTEDILVSAPPTSAAPIFILGTSESSARMAGRNGYAYVYAHHFSGHGTEAALEAYRREFRPSPELERPRAIATMNAAVADTSDEAYLRALPALLRYARMFTGGGDPFAVETVEAAQGRGIDSAEQQVIDALLPSWTVDSGEAARRRIEAFADDLGIGEVMLLFASSARDGEPTDRWIGVEQGLTLLAPPRRP